MVIIFVVVLVILCALLYVVAGSTNGEEAPAQLPEATSTKVVEIVEPTSPPKPIEVPAIPIYSVTQGTNLYDALDVYANVIADLSTGSKLIPANGATRLDCESFVDASVTYELCKVEVMATGKTGWVLKKWISKDY